MHKLCLKNNWRLILKTKSEKEIKEFFAQCFKHEYDFRSQNVDVYFNDKMVEVKVTWMYDAPDFTEEIRNEMVEFFGTQNIVHYDDISNSGCETCDYGSSYGYVFRIWK